MKGFFTGIAVWIIVALVLAGTTLLMDTVMRYINR